MGNGAIRTRKEINGMTMHGPQKAQSVQSDLGQGHETVFVAFTAADMHLHAPRGDEPLDFTDGEYVGNRFHFGRLDDIEPLPIELENVLQKELQAIAIDFDRAPRVRFDQFGEVRFQFFARQSIGTTVEALGKPAYGARINVDGAVAHTAPFQSAQVLLIKRIKANLFGGLRDKLLSSFARSSALKSVA